MEGIIIGVTALSAAFLGLKSIKVFFPWLVRDVIYLKNVFLMLKRTTPMVKNEITFADRLQHFASCTPDKAFVLYKDEVWTFKGMYEWMNRTTRALHQLGLRKGDKIALLMYNEPAYIAILLACMRLGVEPALINHNLREEVLAHDLGVVDIKLLVVGGEDALMQAVADVNSDLKISVIGYTKSWEGREDLKSIIDRQSSGDLEKELRPKFPLTKTACFIFTSGTTGRAKAVRMTFEKLTLGSHMSTMCSFRPDDVLYCSLPFYHTAGCMAGILTAVNAGITFAVRNHFSASNFVSDCRKFNATIVQYIGETMRYICLQSPTDQDRNHKIRLAYGNGIRPDVWQTFLDRFGPDIHVVEFYAASEGNATFINLFDKIGAVGFCSPLMKALTKVAFVRYDEDTEAPYRDTNGRCVEVGFNEPGLLLGKITNTAKPMTYEGNKQLSEAKIVRSVFQEGDAYFNMGDLMIRDRDYSVYFCDRIGDTFRWKGENVSTCAVGDVIVKFPGISDANVYGVMIKGKNGRAGMAALTLDNPKIDLDEFYKYCSEKLPKYAIPLFLRVCQSLNMTSTMKHRKVKLKQEGFDMDLVGDDDLYFLHPDSKSYVRMSQEILTQISENKIKV